MRLGFFRYLLQHFSPVDAIRLLREARRPLQHDGSILRVIYRGEGRQATLELRRGTTDLNVFFEVFYQRVYEMNNAAEPAVVVDLGANIGMASLWFAGRYPGVKIFAFEPVPSNAAAARRHLHGNGLSQVSLFEEAAGDFSGTGRISQPVEGRFGDCTIQTVGANDTVEVTFLDASDLLEKLDLERIDLLKIDVEGAEHVIFPRLKRDLPRIASIVGEMHGQEQQRHTTLTLLEETHVVRTWPVSPDGCLHFHAQRREG